MPGAPASAGGRASGPSGSVADAFRAVRAHLPASLVPSADADRIDAIATLLPGALTTGLGFECHLGERPPHTDLLVRIKGAEVGRDVLAGTSAVDALPPFLAEDPTWARLSRVARDWADPAHRLHASIDNLWLEFDVDPLDDRTPLPSFFMGASGGILSRKRTVPPQGAEEAYGWVTTEALPRVLGRPLAAATARQLVRTLDAQPSDGNVFQVGVMLARASDAVRLCLTGLPPDRIVPYLEEIGWPGCGEEVHELVGRLAGLVDHLAVDLDVADTVSGKVGVECYLPDAGQPGTEPQWRVFLDHLVESGLCRPEQREALTAFPGFTPEVDGPGSRHVAAAASLLGARATSGYARIVSHVKVTYAPGVPLEAKVYVGSVHHWLTADGAHGVADPGSA